jgi:Spy/CpxP family protein refolding chaperone
MKLLKTIALALLFGTIFTLSAYADGKPNQGGPGNGGKPGGPGNFGLSDSCWKVFVSQLSPADAAKLAADQQTISGNQAQIDALNKQLGDLFKSGGRDSATRAKIKDLSNQLETLNKADGAAQMDIQIIIKNNGSLFETVAQNCGRPTNPRDTGKGGPGNGGPGPGDKGGRGHFGLSDSCWNIFLTQISPADAAQLAADQQTVSDNQKKIEDLYKQIRSLKGSAKDSSIRAQIKDLMDQIRTLLKSSGDAMKDFASIIRKNNDILQSIRKDCGRHSTHKGNPGDPTNGMTVGEITPNPTTPGGQASITITLTADAPVMISIGNATAQGPPAKIIFNGLLTAGAHTQTLDLTGIGPGMYLLTIQSGNEVITKKLVIQ